MRKVQSFFSRLLRYHETPESRPDVTELVTINKPESLRSKRPPQIFEDVTLVVGERSLNDGDTEINGVKPQKPRWAIGVGLCAKASALVLLLSVLFVAIAAGLAREYPENGGFSSSAIFYEGSCTLTHRWTIALQLLINILSTGLLAASNYCMQSLGAPTRQVIDEHHGRGRWLDIGCMSFRNLRAMRRDRFLLWVVLLVTATPLHLLYNSMIFQSVGVNDYSVVVAPQDLAAHNIATLTTPALEACFGSEAYIPGRIDWHALVSNVTSGNYERLTLEQCADFMKGANRAGTKSILALADGLFVDQGGDATILETDWWGGGLDGGTGSGWSVEDQVFAWHFAGEDIVLGLSGRDGIQYYDGHNFTKDECIHHISSPGNIAACSNATNLLQWVQEMDSTPSVQTVDKYMSSHEISNITVHLAEVCEPSIGRRTYSIQGCLAVKTAERCQLLYSPPLAIVIVLTTLAKVMTMFLSARIISSQTKPLLVVGDAVASFMLKPDPTTKGKCWLSSANIRRENWSEPEAATSKRLPPRKFWMQASSIPRWVAALGFGLMSILAGAALLEVSIKYAAGSNSLWLQPSEFRKWWTSGFNTSYSSEYLIGFWQLSTLNSLVVANTPQLILTLSYYFYNGVLTNMLAAAEYSSYAVHRRPLRVTFPARNSGQQSTYWLSIPHTYNIPVVLAYMLLHWMVSQSLYYEQTVPYDLSDRPDSYLEISSLGYAPLPIFLSLLIAAIMLCVLVGIGCRRFRTQMPLASSNSAAISAACHPPKGEALGTAVIGPVSWGVVQWEGRETGHCSFSSLETEQPCAMREYG